MLYQFKQIVRMKPLYQIPVIVFIISLIAGCVSQEGIQDAGMSYPATAKIDHDEEYFGTKVADPYYWLEDDESEETEEWVTLQNEVTFNYLDQINFREQVKSRLEELMDYERISAPFVEGDYEYFYKNDGLQDHSVLYRTKKGSDE